jgi:hypothetical protein
MFFSFSHNHIGMMIHARQNPGFNLGNEKGKGNEKGEMNGISSK